MAKGGSKGKVEGVNLPPTLPSFPESKLPSAKQPGLLIGIVDSNGDVWLGISDGTQWNKFIIGKGVGEIPQYEDDGNGNPVIDHPNMPLVGGDAVVESGNNANGEYVRYADGTQICWGTVSPSIGSAQWGSSGVYRSDTSGNNDADWTYPKSFVSNPKVFANAQRFNTIGYTISISTTVAEIGIMEDATSVTRSCSVMAIGRWK